MLIFTWLFHIPWIDWLMLILHSGGDKLHCPSPWHTLTLWCFPCISYPSWHWYLAIAANLLYGRTVTSPYWIEPIGSHFISIKCNEKICDSVLWSVTLNSFFFYNSFKIRTHYFTLTNIVRSKNLVNHEKSKQAFCPYLTLKFLMF